MQQHSVLNLNLQHFYIYLNQSHLGFNNHIRPYHDFFFSSPNFRPLIKTFVVTVKIFKTVYGLEFDQTEFKTEIMPLFVMSNHNNAMSESSFLSIY